MSVLPLLFPPPFALGDLIGIAAPASPPDQPEIIGEAIARLTAYGFRIQPGRNLEKRTGYLAGSDEERAEDINALFANPDVKAVFALRGGYGSCRILSLLDYDLIRANPKPFIGYSDITAMHNAILVKSGLVTFHGSNASSAFQPGNVQTCRQVLMAPMEISRKMLFSRDSTQGKKIETLVSRQATGQLIGGNMTCLLRLIGTPYAPDFRNAILFLEDTGEKAYRIDGNFTHLRLAGVLPQIGGLILGQFDHADPKEEVRIQECLQREATRLGVPCITGAPIGHFAEQVMLPHGVTVKFDADAGTLSLL